MFYGGAAGGGKSDALLMAALQYVDVPGYAALILRRTYKDLSEPGALMDRANTWLQGTDAKGRKGGTEWHFPSGARLVFGHVQYHREAESQFSGAEFHYIGIDELTRGWEERTYQFLMSRIRRPAKGSMRFLSAGMDGTTIADVPLRMRSASNPGGGGHDWVKKRFVNPATAEGVFIPAKLSDNPHLAQEEYEATLMRLDPVTRERLLRGDWDIQEAGAVFNAGDFKFVAERPTGKRIKWCRYWDFAATDSLQAADPDWTVGALVGVDRREGQWYLADIVRVQKDPHGVESTVKFVAETDGRKVPVVIEQEPGSSGKLVIDHFKRHILLGFEVHGDRPSGPKVERSRPMAGAVASGNYHLVTNPDDPVTWLGDFIHEVEMFPSAHAGAHDDQVDATSGGFNWLAAKRSGSGLIA